MLGLLGFATGFRVEVHMGWAASYWMMGTIYNIPPVRSKDLPYLDVLSESINNPIRMAMGWYMTGASGPPPLSILLAYWMFGAYLMAIKRLAEYRTIADAARAAAYRKSFAYYNEERLVTSILFYGAMFTSFATVFIVFSRLEIVLATPLLAYAGYTSIWASSREPGNIPSGSTSSTSFWVWSWPRPCCGVLLFLDVPLLHRHLAFP